MNTQQERPAPLEVLYLEDMQADVELVTELLADEFGQCAVHSATNRQEFLSLIEQGPYDVILADYTLPDFDAGEALAIARERQPDTPFICVSGTIGEDRAVELLKQGATDYVLKDRMGRLGSAIRRAMESAEAERLHRRSDELNRLLVENMSDVLWVLDLQSLRFTYVSPSVERLLGYTPDEMIGESIETAVTDGERVPLLEGLRQRVAAFESGDPEAIRRVDDVAQPCKDGTVVETEVATTLRLGPDNRLEIIGATRDVTARKRAERELADYRDQLEDMVATRTQQLYDVVTELERSSRAKEQFFAHMSHELRTPLNSIIGFSGLLLMGKAGDLTPEQLEQIRAINRSGELLLQLVNDLLDLSRLDAQRAVVVPEPFDAVALVEECVATEGSLALERGIALGVEVPDGPIHVRSDRRMVMQVLLNLISNALKFTDEGSVTVRVGTTERRVDFSVTDTGCGIAPEHLEEIFEEFYQVTDDPALRREGTGLGLAISRRMSRLLGGELRVESTVGSGSTFTLSVPDGVG